MLLCHHVPPWWLRAGTRGHPKSAPRVQGCLALARDARPHGITAPRPLQHGQVGTRNPVTGDAGGLTAPRATRLGSSTAPGTRCGFWLPVPPFWAVTGTCGAGNQRQSKQGTRGGLSHLNQLLFTSLLLFLCTTDLSNFSLFIFFFFSTPAVLKCKKYLL